MPQFSDVISLEGVAPTKKPAVPIIAVPTTAGTAAEVTINYVITDTSKNRKMVCVDPHDIPVVAVVDPDMMSSMPKGLTAATGMDALTHAIEGYITAGAWELSDMFHLKAIEIISKSLRGAVENTPEGREGMALGQYIAGMGFSNVGLGIVHSMAHPLGALYDTPHGVANAIILPTVMEYNAPATGEKYRDIAKAMGVKGTDDMTQEEYRKAAVDAVRKLSQDVGIPANLKDIVKEEDIPFLGKTLGFAGANQSSATKGETVADTARVVSCYADIIAMRHPKEGAPLRASMYSSIPVINAGDGGHNHPTQTLIDLMTIRHRKGRLDNLTVGFCGDLKFGRTVHSLVNSLVRFNDNKFYFISPEELKVPDYLIEDTLIPNKSVYKEVRSL